MSIKTQAAEMLSGGTSFNVRGVGASCGIKPHNIKNEGLAKSMLKIYDLSRMEQERLIMSSHGQCAAALTMRRLRQKLEARRSSQ